MWCVRNDVRFVVGYDTKMVLAVDRKTFWGRFEPVQRTWLCVVSREMPTGRHNAAARWRVSMVTTGVSERNGILLQKWKANSGFYFFMF